MFLRAACFCFSDDIAQPPRSLAGYERFLAVAFPPLRPAAFFCAVVPPCEALPPEPERWPPCLEASGEFAIFAARCLDMPLSFSASYCFSFLTAMILLLVVCSGTGRRPARREPDGKPDREQRGDHDDQPERTHQEHPEHDHHDRHR